MASAGRRLRVPAKNCGCEGGAGYVPDEKILHEEEIADRRNDGRQRMPMPRSPWRRSWSERLAGQATRFVLATALAEIENSRLLVSCGTRMRTSSRADTARRCRRRSRASRARSRVGGVQTDARGAESQLASGSSCKLRSRTRAAIHSDDGLFVSSKAKIWKVVNGCVAASFDSDLKAALRLSASGALEES